MDKQPAFFKEATKNQPFNKPCREKARESSKHFSLPDGYSAAVFIGFFEIFMRIS